MTEQQLLDLEPALANFLDRFVGCCAYRPTFAHLCTYVRGLLSELPRKSVEPIALKAGTAVRTLQEFLKDHAWDHAAVGARLAAFAAEQLGSAADPDRLGTVGVIDETSALKQGDKTPGVQRQYLGCAGKVANGVVTVHLGVARGRFKALIDSELFLPQKWSGDRPRCRAAGIPDGVAYRPKWRIALEQLDRATAAGVALDWLCFDADYGKSPGFLAGLDQRQQRFAGEVPRTLSCLVAGRGGRPTDQDEARPAEHVVRAMRQFRDQRWRSVRLGRQTQAEQLWRYKAARVYLHGEGGWSAGAYWLVWACSDHTGEEKFILSNAPEGAPAETLVKAAFARWNVEHAFRVAKSELGFTHFEGRNYVALMRHHSLCLVALAFVSSRAEAARGGKPGADGRAAVPGAGGADAVLAGQQAGQQRAGVRQAGHLIPPEAQPRGAAVTPERGEPARAARPQEAPASKAQTKPPIHREVKVAL